MKLEWVNNGKDFEIPKLTVDIDLEIIGYMNDREQKIKDDPVLRNITEFKETVYRLLNVVDKNITREMVGSNLSTNELGVLYAVMRRKGKVKCTCPFCKKDFMFDEMPDVKKQGDDIPLSEKKPDDSTGMNNGK